MPAGFFEMTDSRLATITAVSSLSEPTHEVLTPNSSPAFFHAYLWAFQYSMVLMQLTTTYSLFGSIIDHSVPFAGAAVTAGATATIMTMKRHPARTRDPFLRPLTASTSLA